MKQEKTTKQWVNHKGEVVPEKYISGYDKKKEKALAKLLKEAEAVSEKLADLKKRMFEENDSLEELDYKEHNMVKPDTKGNRTMYSFDKRIKFSMKVQDVIEFDDRITMAQQKINEFLESKNDGADEDLMLLVNNAFKTTKGRLDKSRIFSLFGLAIKNETWKEAMELIKQSINTNHTRRYSTIAVRDESGNYKEIPLNISSI